MARVQSARMACGSCETKRMVAPLSCISLMRLKQRGDAAFVLDMAVRRLQRARDDLKQSGFAGTVRADDARRRSSLKLEAHIAQSPELTMTFPASARQGFLQAVARMSVDAILL